MLKRWLFLLGFAAIGSVAAVEFEAAENTPRPDAEIVYKKTASEELKLYVYKPENWRADDRRPLLLMYHGGGWRGGNPSQFAGQCRDYAKKGFVAVTASYRLARGNDLDSYFQTLRDAKSAIRQAKARAAELGIDPGKIVTIGSSAGAHLALSVALFETINDPADDANADAAPAATVLLCPVVGAGPGSGSNSINRQFKERYAEFSPIHHLRKNLPPQLIILGTADHILSEEYANTYKKEVEKLGSRCDLVMIEGAKHGAFYRDLTKEKYYSRTVPLVLDFLKSLKLTPPDAE